MMTEAILRQARHRDIPSITKILKPWCGQDPFLAENLDAFLAAGPTGEVRCTIVESDKRIRCVSLWKTDGPGQIRVLALGSEGSWTEPRLECRLLKEQILEWADMGIVKASVDIPEALLPNLIDVFNNSGFLFEGIESRWSLGIGPIVRLSKHFLYRDVPRKELMGFLKEFLNSLGYEVRDEEEGFRYRIREEFRRPFMFNPWHSVTTSGPDILLHPPARKIHRHEIEDLFYPLTIHSPADRPILLPMEKELASKLVDIPHGDPRQASLFGPETIESGRPLRFNNLIYCHSISPKALRKGLPLLFYINKLGAVGSARMEDFYLDEPGKLYGRFIEMADFDPQDVQDHAAKSGSNQGKLLIIRFHYYRPLRKTVGLDEIRTLDSTFNPQRGRSISPGLFQAILAAGNNPDRHI